MVEVILKYCDLIDVIWEWRVALFFSFWELCRYEVVFEWKPFRHPSVAQMGGGGGMLTAIISSVFYMYIVLPKELFISLWH
jgi:hypothetical protein